jgi:hypothetical protein
MQIYFDQQQLRKQRRFLRLKLYFGIFIFILICFAAFYIVLYSPIFQIRNFSIRGAEYFSDEAILNIVQPIVLNSKIRNFLGQNNLLSWREGKIDTSNTSLSEVYIDRDWFCQAVEINVKERERFAIWCGKTASVCHWIDRKGMLFMEAPQTEGFLILTIYDDSQDPAILGKKVVEDRFVKNLISILDNLEDLGLPIKNIAFDGTLQEIKVEFYKNPDLLFSIRFDPTLNMASFKSLRDKVGLNGIKYIDLRVENKLFYKNL